ncbi:MAG TPA: flagellin [Kofleriaceae bacterium]|nr:flagellin [Kofleriaceae bacterium]
MSISVLANVTSLTSQRHLTTAQMSLEQSLERLSSGLRINHASDDAAGLGISENLKADIRSLAQASRNANDGISMTQVAEGAMNEMQGIVGRMRELAVQASNGTLGDTERGYIQTEFTELQDEMGRLAEVTEFNGSKLLNGDAASGLNIQIGIHATSSDRLSMSIARLTASTLGNDASGLFISAQSLSTASAARTSLDVFDAAITSLSSARAKLGAVQSRMSVALTNLASAQENLSAANSRIRDVDFAAETANMTRYQILTQAGVAVLGQANQLPALALSLLK